MNQTKNPLITKKELLALLVPIVALILHTAAWPLVQPHIWFAFYTSLYISARIGGERGGIYATFFTALIVYIFELKPIFSLLKTNLGDYISMAFFIVVGIAFAKTQGKLDGKLLDLKLSNQKLKESKEHLEAVINNEPECIKIIDNEGRLIKMNPAGLEMIEAESPEQIIGRSVLDIIAPEYRNSYEAMHKRVLAGELMHMEYETIGLRGGRRHLETTAAPMEEDGKIVHLAVTRDISWKKEHDNLRNLLLSSLGDGVFGVDIEGKCTFINKSALEMIGYAEAEVLGFNQHRLFHYSHRDYSEYAEDDCPIFQTLTDGLARESEDAFVAKNGAPFDIYLKVSPILQNKAVIGAVAVFRDITEKKQMEENLRSINRHLHETIKAETEKRLEQEKLLIQQSKMASMGEMVGAIGHQWRQPLNALGLYIQDLLMAYKYGELDEKYLQEHKTATMGLIHTMSNTIDDFRNFFSTNKQKEEFCVEDAIKDVLKILSAQLKINNIEVLFDEEQKHLYGCYKNELKQVLLNIIANAKDALVELKPQNSFIKISLEQTEEKLLVTLEDSAGGIPENIIDKIFDAHFTTKPEDKGTGIGLYMSKEIVENSLGGKLLVENTQNGAKFSIELPTAQ